MSMRNALQCAVVARLLADQTVIRSVADAGDHGRAVFASTGQDYDPNTWPRLTIDTPQRLGAGVQCSTSRSECFVTLHAWGKGAASTLDAGAAADAAIEALTSEILVIDGFRASAPAELQSSRPVGDPDASVEHVVTVLRFILQPTS